MRWDTVSLSYFAKDLGIQPGTSQSPTGPRGSKSEKSPWIGIYLCADIEMQLWKIPEQSGDHHVLAGPGSLRAETDSHGS